MKQGDRLKVFDTNGNQLYYGSVVNDSTFNLYDFEENLVYYGKKVVDGVFNLFAVGNDVQPMYRVTQLDFVAFHIKNSNGVIVYLGRIHQ